MLIYLINNWNCFRQVDDEDASYEMLDEDEEDEYLDDDNEEPADQLDLVEMEELEEQEVDSLKFLEQVDRINSHLNGRKSGLVDSKLDS